jgi:hypothetical protein
MAGNGLNAYLELGPGRSVSNMIVKIAGDAETRAVNTLEEILALVGG